MKNKVRLSVLAAWLFALVLFGTVGYRLILDSSWVSSFYMTIITISTVGYGEIAQMTDGARLFSVLLIILSIGIVGYVVSSLVSYFFEGELQENWRRRKMREQIDKMNQHYIICGFGETGHIVVDRLVEGNHPYVVVENEPESLTFLREHKIVHLAGDATQEETLIKAGIHKAKGLVASIARDAENLFVVLTARELNANLTIVAKAINHSAHQKLMRAGATHTVSPTEIGGHRMAAMLLRPGIIAFLDSITKAGEIELDLEDIRLEEDSLLCGKLLREARIPEKTGLMVLAIQHPGGEMLFNPKSDTQLQENDHLFVLGRPEQIQQLTALSREK